MSNSASASVRTHAKGRAQEYDALISRYLEAQAAGYELYLETAQGVDILIWDYSQDDRTR